jgi:hypothetical protein
LRSVRLRHSFRPAQIKNLKPIVIKLALKLFEIVVQKGPRTTVKDEKVSWKEKKIRKVDPKEEKLSMRFVFRQNGRS